MTASSVQLAAELGSDCGTTIIAAGRIIDEAHLKRMTLGDCRLEREVLQIFVRQAAVIMGRIAGAGPAHVAAAAHTLTGSARGIGAWRVAQAAEQLERASGLGGDQTNEAIVELKAAILEASAAIGARLNDPAR
jgi:HPt (histidine-containing phosphotransfer) domain-containing protein